MEAQAVVIEVRPGEAGGQVAKVIAQVSSRHMADAMATGLQRMQQRGEICDSVGYAYCDLCRLQHTASLYGWSLIK